MKVLYFDTFAGISGDMTLGSLIDLGCDFNFLTDELSKLKLHGYKIEKKEVLEQGIKATKINIIIDEHNHTHYHRNYYDIVDIINNSTLDNIVKEKAIGIFKIIGEAEAKVHKKSLEDIHFHEVGALDSILDIVGSVILIESLKVDRVVSTPLPLGKGFVECAHGKIMLPAPATVEILKDTPTYFLDIEGEHTTPTGAAIIKYYAMDYSFRYNFKIKGVGYGAGTNKKSIPNLLRTCIIEMNDVAQNFSSDSYIFRELFLLETSIDDYTPEFISYVQDKLYSLGALDVYISNLIMKKGRNGIKLSVLVDKDKIGVIIRDIFKETSSIGIRIIKIDRVELKRENKVFKSKYGLINIKESYLDNELINIKAEYEDLKNIAIGNNISIKSLNNEIIREYLNNKPENCI